ITDGLQRGRGNQLHLFTRFNELIRRHLERGGSFAFVAGMADRYPDARGRRDGSAPVFAFLFADGQGADDLRTVASRMAAPLRPAGGVGDGGRYFLLPPAGSGRIRVTPRRGVAGADHGDGSRRDSALPFLRVKPGKGAMEIVARIELDSLARANLPPTLTATVERCVNRGWARVDDDSADWVAAVRKDRPGTR